MSGPVDRFDLGPDDAGLDVVERDLQAFADETRLTPAPDLTDRIMAAIAVEPVPTPPATFLHAVGALALGDAWRAWRLNLRVALGAGESPGRLRIQALAVVVVAALLVGLGGTTVAVGAAQLVAAIVAPSVPDLDATPTPDLSPSPQATPSPSTDVSPSPSPSTSPDPSEVPGESLEPGESNEPEESDDSSGPGSGKTATPRPTKTEHPEETDHEEEADHAEETQTPEPAETPKPTSTSGGSGSSGPGSSGSGSDGSSSGSSGSGIRGSIRLV